MKIRSYKNYTREELLAKLKRIRAVIQRVKKDIGEDKIAKFERLGL